MTETTFSLTRWARCEIEEIQRLEELKVSGTCTRIYLILRSFCREKVSCFPSLKTIVKHLGCKSKSAVQIVCRGLATLERLGLIKRNHKTSKERFVMSELSSVKQKRQIELNKNVNKTEATEHNSLFNKREIQKNKKKRPQIEWKSHKPKSKGLRQIGGFDGGLRFESQKTTLPKPESLFSDIIKHERRINPRETAILQDHILICESFRDFVIAYHPKRHTEIMGVAPSSSEITEAQKRIEDELKRQMGFIGNI